MTIGDGTTTTQYITLEGKVGYECYVILPDGGIVESVDGYLVHDYDGIAGNVKLIVAKDGLVSISNSKLIGKLVTETTGSVEMVNCQLITDFEANNSYNVNAQGASLSAKSIGDWLYAVSIDYEGYVGNGNFSLGTNANETAINAYLVATYNKTLVGLTQVGAPLANFTLTFN